MTEMAPPGVDVAQLEERWQLTLRPIDEHTLWTMGESLGPSGPRPENWQQAITWLDQHSQGLAARDDNLAETILQFYGAATIEQAFCQAVQYGQISGIAPTPKPKPRFPRQSLFMLNDAAEGLSHEALLAKYDLTAEAFAERCASMRDFLGASGTEVVELLRAAHSAYVRRIAGAGSPIAHYVLSITHRNLRPQVTVDGLAVLEGRSEGRSNKHAVPGVPLGTAKDRLDVTVDELDANGVPNAVAKAIALRLLPFEEDLDFEHVPLTDRQAEVLRAIILHSDDSSIANALGVSEETIASHITLLMRKMGARKREQAVRRAFELGIVVLAAEVEPRA